MTHDPFLRTGRRTPYAAPPDHLLALRERIRLATTSRPSAAALAPSWRLWALGAAAAAIVAAVAVAGLQRHRHPQPDLERMLSTASPETVRRAAAVNYDDILYNQSL